MRSSCSTVELVICREVADIVRLMSVQNLLDGRGYQSAALFELVTVEFDNHDRVISTHSSSLSENRR